MNSSQCLFNVDELSIFFALFTLIRIITSHNIVCLQFSYSHFPFDLLLFCSLAIEFRIVCVSGCFIYHHFRPVLHSVQKAVFKRHYACVCCSFSFALFSLFFWLIFFFKFVIDRKSYTKHTHAAIPSHW